MPNHFIYDTILPTKPRDSVAEHLAQRSYWRTGTGCEFRPAPRAAQADYGSATQAVKRRNCTRDLLSLFSALDSIGHISRFHFWRLSFIWHSGRSVPVDSYSPNTFDNSSWIIVSLFKRYKTACFNHFFESHFPSSCYMTCKIKYIFLLLCLTSSWLVASQRTLKEIKGELPLPYRVFSAPACRRPASPSQVCCSTAALLVLNHHSCALRRTLGRDRHLWAMTTQSGHSWLGTVPIYACSPGVNANSTPSLFKGSLFGYRVYHQPAGGSFPVLAVTLSCVPSISYAPPSLSPSLGSRSLTGPRGTLILKLKRITRLRQLSIVSLNRSIDLPANWRSFMHCLLKSHTHSYYSYCQICKPNSFLVKVCVFLCKP